MIDFIDLKTQQKLIKSGLDRRISDVLKHGQYILGPEVKELEEKLSNYSNSKYVLCCSSGTDALLLALISLDLKQGEGVIVPSFTFASTPEVVCMLGSVPIFADVNMDTYNLCEESILQGISKGKKIGIDIKGIISVGLFGQPCDMDKIEEISKKYNLWVLDDAAQSFGAKYKGKISGNLAKVSATSFFPAKPLGCYGDGGAFFSNNEDLYKIAYSAHLHGMGKHKYDYERIGMNGRMDTIQAAILLEKLEIFDNELKKRQIVADTYIKNFKNLNSDIKLPVLQKEVESTWAQFTVQLPSYCNREIFQLKMREKNIPTAIYYPIPLHFQKPYRNFPISTDELKNTNYLSKCVISLPMHPYLKDDVILYISKTVDEIINEMK